MARFGARRFFLGGKGKPGAPESLFERDDCDIEKCGDDICLSLTTGPWTERHTKLARRYRANSLIIGEQSFGDRKTADFLLDLPMLSSVSISIWSPRDLSSLSRLPDLRSLRIAFSVAGCAPGRPVTAGRLFRLEET